MIKQILGDRNVYHPKRKTIVYLEGEEVELIKMINNFYGMFCRVRRKDGTVEDVFPKDITLTKEDSNV